MHAIVETRRDEIAALCRKHRVRRLDVFGSAANGTFDPELSDIDFLVEFEEMDHTSYADAYLALLEALERLFGRHVDLVTHRSIRNNTFRRNVFASREAVYG